MRVGVFSAQQYDIEFLGAANHALKEETHKFTYFPVHLGVDTVHLARECDAVCAFVNDVLSTEVLENLAKLGVKAIVMRCAGQYTVGLFCKLTFEFRIQ
jgi:D-lactate dehydrogenase